MSTTLARTGYLAADPAILSMAVEAARIHCAKLDQHDPRIVSTTAARLARAAEAEIERVGAEYRAKKPGDYKLRVNLANLRLFFASCKVGVGPTSDGLLTPEQAGQVASQIVREAILATRQEPDESTSTVEFDAEQPQFGKTRQTIRTIKTDRFDRN